MGKIELKFDKFEDDSGKEVCRVAEVVLREDLRLQVVDYEDGDVSILEKITGQLEAFLPGGAVERLVENAYGEHHGVSHSEAWQCKFCEAMREIKALLPKGKEKDGQKTV